MLPGGSPGSGQCLGRRGPKPRRQVCFGGRGLGCEIPRPAQALLRLGATVPPSRGRSVRAWVSLARVPRWSSSAPMCAPPLGEEAPLLLHDSTVLRIPLHHQQLQGSWRIGRVEDWSAGEDVPLLIHEPEPPEVEDVPVPALGRWPRELAHEEVLVRQAHGPQVT